ncbi:uracil-DNA glycosylase [SAR86 cluster bacterium]|jgi:uracil-DNA glycosylase|nr:uracil-DNA glycosylase [SAR86 cluster bacterium]
MTDILLEKEWLELLNQEFHKEYMRSLRGVLVDCANQKISICPHPKNIFRALNLTPPSKVKVIIIGQDPYHGYAQANGLAFSVDDGVRLPPSLQNIFKELSDDLGHPIPKNGNLEKWSDQGVLLLNSSLTVELNKPNSHKDIGWEIFTDQIIKTVSDISGKVFILWGSYAQKKEAIINSEKNLILKSPHPSPLSAYKGFFGCKHFSRANAYLKQQKISAIDWQLS